MSYSVSPQAAARELLQRRRARASLIDYARYTNTAYRPAKHHELIAEKLEAVERGDCKRLMVFMPPRHGKLCSDDTPVFTPDGWRQHGDLEPGHQVYSPSGRAVTVLAVSRPASAEWVVETTSGERIQCHGAHEWTVFDRAYGKWRTLETVAMARRALWNGPAGKRGGRATLQLPDTQALAGSEKIELLLDPYALGVWLGDGSTTKPHITMSEEDSVYVISAIEAAGYVARAKWVHRTTGVPTFSFGSGKPGVGSAFQKALRAYEVLGSKRIPEAYIVTGVAQRLQLLAGLVDTGGHVERETGRVVITTVCPDLAEDIFRLATTLAFRPYAMKAEPVVSASGICGRRPVYTIGFQPNLSIPTRIPRKQCNVVAVRRRVGIRAVYRAKRSLIGRCIQVSSEDGLYLVGRSLVATHNSELGSRRFPAWFMGRNPKRSMIAASYNSDLAGDFGREVRNIVASPEHRMLFPGSMLAADSAAANRWHTAAGGAYAAVGVGTATTGRGAHALLIDDPTKDRESADSEIIREKTYLWYLSTAYTRLEGTLTEPDEDPLWRDLDEAQEKGESFDGAIILISTRWHQDDLAGRLLADMAGGADQWDVLSLPAIRDRKALWPAKYSYERMMAVKRVLTPRDWEALYQQNPTPAEGTYFQRHWFNWHTTAPENVRVYITADFAVTDGGGDFTEFGVWAVDEEGKVYCIDWWSGQTTALVWVDALIDLIAKHKPAAFFGETGQIRRAVEPLLRKRMRERKTFCRLEWLSRTRDKAAMARPFQGRAEMGMISFPATPLGREIVEQIVSFPTGKHDDKVDAAALMGLALERAHSAIMPSGPEKRERPDDYGAGWDKTDAEEWKVI